MRKPTILTIPWKKHGEVIERLGTDIDSFEISHKLIFGTEKEEINEIVEFLRNIGLVENNKLLLSQIGNDYFIAKYIKGDIETSRRILFNQLKNYEPVISICQLLWGIKDLNKKKIYYVLAHRRFIDSPAFMDNDLGSFLVLLNEAKIINYNRKKLTILYKPEMEVDSPDFKSYFIDKEKPYSNLMNLKKCIRACKEYIWWFEKHFSKKIFEILAEEASGEKIKCIKLLFGTEHINESVHAEFKRLKSELEERGIESEFRVICSKDLLNSLHGRWILSKGLCFKIPPINTILQGQADEISKTDNRPDFESWWKTSRDLLDDWNEINKLVNKKEGDKNGGAKN